MPLPRKQKRFQASPPVGTLGVWQHRNSNGRVKLVRHSSDAPAPFFRAGDLSAKLPPYQREGRARKLRSVRFNLRNSDQFALLDVPEIRYWLIWHRRVLIINAASRMLDARLCSLNLAARLLDVPPSSLCVLLQRFRAGGNAALMPKFKTPLAATGCRLSVYLRT